MANQQTISKDDRFRENFDNVIRAIGDVIVMCVIVYAFCRLFDQTFDKSALALAIALVAYLRTRKFEDHIRDTEK